MAVKSRTRSAFGNPVAKANTWVNEVGDRMKWNDRHLSLRALRAVLHALRDCLTVDENAQLSSQLPLVIRGVYFEGWRPHAKVGRNVNELLARIQSQLPEVNPAEVQRAAHVVFDILGQHVSRGEIEDIGAVLPGDLKEFWNVSVA